MKTELNQKEKAERLARRMARVEFYVLLAACVIGILSFCERFQLIFGVDFRVAVFLLLMLVTMVIDLLHTKLFPEKIAKYPVHVSVFGAVYKEYSVEMLTKRRLIGGGIVIGVTLFFTVLANIFRPIETAPENIPPMLFYDADGSRIMVGDFGEIAQWSERRNEWSICTSIDAYGPFQYGGEIEEMSILHIVTDDVVWGESNQEFANRTKHEILAIKFNHYEDGDWMIVKRFVDGGAAVATEYDDGLSKVLDELGTGEIPYTKHDLAGNTQDKITVLTIVTNDALEWEKVDGKLVWSIAE